MAIDEQKMMQSVYDTLFGVYTSPPPGGLPAGSQENKTFLTFVPGGNPVDIEQFANPWNPNNTEGSTAATENFSKLVDQVPSVKAAYSPNGNTVSGIYKQIVEGAKIRQLPEDPAAKAAYEKAFKFLNADGTDYDDEGKPITVSVDSPVYRNYKIKQIAYANALATFMASYKKYEKMTPADQREWSILGPALQRPLIDAWNDLQNAQAKRIEDNLAILAQSAENQVGRVFKDAQEKFSLLRRGSLSDPLSQWWPSYAFPANWYSSGSAAGWPTLSLSSRSYQLNENSSFSKYGGGASVSFGLWSFGGSASHQSESYHMDTQTDSLDVSFKYARISIQRPWLDALVFSLPGWSWPPQPVGGFSSGDPKNAGNTPFTILPTALIVTRDLKISATWGKTDLDMIKKATSGSASFGWGPFSVGGSYSSGSSSKKFKSEFDGRTLSAPGLQIAGWLCTVVPKCPPEA